MDSIFVDGFKTQQLHQKATSRTQKDIENYRAEVDAIILELWEQVERANVDMPPKKRINKNKEYGIVYYYRKGETIE